MNLSDFSDAELKQELGRRKQAYIESETKRRQELAKYYCNNIDNILAFVPEHGRTSCNDTNICNAYCEEYKRLPRCNRCFLLACKQEDYFPENIAIELVLSFLPSLESDR